MRFSSPFRSEELHEPDSLLSRLVPARCGGANEDFTWAAAYKAKNYAEAEKKLRLAVSGDENNPQFRLRLGAIYKQKEHDDVIKSSRGWWPNTQEWQRPLPNGAVQRAGSCKTPCSRTRLFG